MTHTRTMDRQNADTNQRGGYTLVEMLMVIAIVGIVLSVPLVSYTGATRDVILQSGQATVIQALAGARSRAVSGAGAQEHGVHLESEYVTLFTGSSYSGSGSVHPLPAGVHVDSASVGSSFVFMRLTGATTAGTITVRDSRGKTEHITIYANGFIE